MVRGLARNDWNEATVPHCWSICPYRRQRLIDHQLLGIHHVRDDLGAPLVWDLGFLVLRAALIAIGVALARRPG